jgi:hypothetical protein
MISENTTRITDFCDFADDADFFAALRRKLVHPDSAGLLPLNPPLRYAIKIPR